MSDEPVNFLQQLRSGGPWLLIAIEPDGRPVATTATNADEVRAFVRGYDRSGIFIIPSTRPERR